MATTEHTECDREVQVTLRFQFFGTEDQARAAVDRVHSHLVTELGRVVVLQFVDVDGVPEAQL